VAGLGERRQSKPNHCRSVQRAGDCFGERHVTGRLQPQASTTLSDCMITRLERHGVRHVFGIPGTHNLQLYEALAKSAISHVMPRHEQGAGYAADGYARATGMPGVCLVTTGPGLTNIVTAVATAYADSVPMLVISPGMPDSVNGHDTGLLHELRDQRGMMCRVASNSVRVNTAEQAVAAIDHAFASFLANRPRPVHIEVPLDRLDADSCASFSAIMLTQPALDQELIQRAAEILAAARAPALILGGGAKDAGKPALALARLLQAPIVTTVNAKGAVPERDPLALGASIRLRCIQDFLRTRDAILVVGSELAESDLWRMPPLEARGPIIRVDIDPAQLQKNAASDLPIHGEAASALRQLADYVVAELYPHVHRPPADLATLRAAALAEARRDGAQFEPLMEVLASALDSDAIIASDSTMACYYGAIHFLQQAGPRQLLYPTGYATLGYGLPAAIGAKLALPHRQVIALMGDGGVLFTIQELATAAEQDLALPVIVVLNRGYGEIRRGMERRGMPTLAADFDPPDFARIAEGFGAHGVHAHSYDEVGEHLADALRRTGPTVIEVEEERRG
jgi:thiamine pyrophosphate-dependent acetolactate synthase large subunit-like protein